LEVDAPILAKATLEGIAMDLADQIGLLAGGTVDIDEVRISGAGGRDRVGAQLRADIIGLPVRSVAPLDAGPTAAAALALAAALPGRSVEAAMAALLELGPTIEPRLDQHRVYREIGQQRRRLRADLAGSRPAAVER
ncbi:MAG: FGGY-family carbohydrate kinase, partial [Chloroflexota bacterium]|nr:FGGY-family carbohydrate kinase [Chloroflexota bacterium]